MSKAKEMVWMSIFIALEIILTRFFSFSIWSMRIGFGFIPIVAAGIWLGPVKGGCVAAVADIVGAILFPTGAYFPGFTLVAFLRGSTYGLLLHKEQGVKRVIVAVLATQFILSLLLNTLCISILYGVKYVPLLATRILQITIACPIQILIIQAMGKYGLSNKLLVKIK